MLSQSMEIDKKKGEIIVCCEGKSILKIGNLQNILCVELLFNNQNSKVEVGIKIVFC